MKMTITQTHTTSREIELELPMFKKKEGRYCHKEGSFQAYAITEEQIISVILDDYEQVVRITPAGSCLIAGLIKDATEEKCEDITEAEFLILLYEVASATMKQHYLLKKEEPQTAEEMSEVKPF